MEQVHATVYRILLVLNSKVLAQNFSPGTACRRI